MEIGIRGKYSGFTLIEEKTLKEVNAKARLFYHEKSGARLFQMENEDDNKVFSISFRTPPSDDTGLPHILEHSVLCGSRKYPSKEPFVELVKGSLNTFLNAMTFSDKTMYPIASRNEKDFYNLMDVYLDAVFYPNIYKHREIFMQEGWHYELENEEAELTINGVVYNEMKGAFSSPESILSRKMQETLYPDTPYSKESGGDPDFIPDLTYEDFTGFHKKYYHPSNSYIYLYGKLDIEMALARINDEYLENFDKQDIDSELPLQKAYDEMRESVVEYPLSGEEDEQGKCYFSLNFAMGEAIQAENYLAFEVLEHILLGTSASPLKKALVESGLGKDVYGQLNNSIRQPYMSVVMKHADLASKDRFREIVYNTLNGLVLKGIDKKLIEASVNIMEFHLREADFRSYPKGLIYNIKSMDSWLYGENPTLHLEYEPQLEKIKQALTTDYFEKMIKTYLLDNKHCSLLILKPEKGLADRKQEEQQQALAEYKRSLPANELKQIVVQTASLKERQNTPDREEDLMKIPLLALEDIEKQAEVLEKDIFTEKGINILRHHAFTNRIAYIQLYFDARTVSLELIPYVGLLADLLGKTSTEKYDYTELSKEINIHTGEIRFMTQVYGDAKTPGAYYPKLTVKSKALVDKLPKLFELQKEILLHHRLDDKKRIKEILQEQKSRLEMKISGEGHIVAIKRLNSYYSDEGQYIERLSGLSYYKFISDLEKYFDNRFEEVQKKLEQVAALLFNKQNMIVMITCDASDDKKVLDSLTILADSISDNRVSLQNCCFDSAVSNEGLMTPGKVQYVAKGYNFAKLGYAYSGALQVLRTVVRYDYLWNQIRVKGGAYGAFSGFEMNGNMFFASYRDPNLQETLKVYDKMHEYLAHIDFNQRELVKYIIGTISRLDTPLTPVMKGERLAENYLRNITQDDIQRERDQILHTEKEDISKLAGMIQACMSQDYFCVLGSEGKIKQNEKLFGKLIQVFE